MNPIVRKTIHQDRMAAAKPAPGFAPPVFAPKGVANLSANPPRMTAPAVYRSNPAAPIQRMAAPSVYKPAAVSTVQRVTAPPAYRPQTMTVGGGVGQPVQGPGQMQLRSAAPPVYRPQLAVSQANRSGANGMLSCSPAPAVSQAKWNLPGGMTAGAVAPPVYRPVPVAKAVSTESRLSGAVQRKLAGAGNSIQAGAAPPVYRPNIAAGGNSLHLQQNSSPALRSSTIQPVICKGKTIRSKAIARLAATDWYKALDSTQRPFAYLLHSEPKRYTKAEAEDEIDKRILRGDPVPNVKNAIRAIRRARVTAYIKTHRPSSQALKYGAILSRAGERAYVRHQKKYRRNPTFGSSIKKVQKNKPGLFKDQKPILTGLTEWQQTVAVTQSTPRSYNFNVDGSKMTIDSLDVMTNDDREKERPQNPVNMSQLFIQQPDGQNSYWTIADSDDSDLWKEKEHQQLRHLEAEREHKAVVTTYLKDALYEQGKMTTEEAFGDENQYAYQEYKGALSPSKAMAESQQASAYYVLQKALLSANTKLGRQVALHPQTTPQEIWDAVSVFMASQTEANFKKLVKQVYRLIRSRTGMDQGSDTEADSDTDY